MSKAPDMPDKLLPPPVRVKDLVWRFYSDVEHEFGWGVYDAKSAIGDLTIEVCGEDDEGLRFHVQQLSATFVSLEDAQDAYYDMTSARIFAYLEPAPADPRVVALTAAGNRAECLIAGYDDQSDPNDVLDELRRALAAFRDMRPTGEPVAALEAAMEADDVR